MNVTALLSMLSLIISVTALSVTSLSAHRPTVDLNAGMYDTGVVSIVCPDSYSFSVGPDQLDGLTTNEVYNYMEDICQYHSDPPSTSIVDFNGEVDGRQYRF